MLGLGKIKRWSIIAPLILFLVTFLIYLHNLSSSVYGGDVGDFLSAIAVKGVAHPSGYPLFTIIGIILSYIPLNQTLAWKVGLISAFFSSLAVVLMYLISKLLTKNVLVSIITALILAFYYTFWLYAEVAEVFALNNFFILLLLFLALLFYFKRNIRFLYALSFFTGLSLSNHEIILLIFPSLLILVLKTDWKILLRPKIILKCLLLFLIGLLPYIYIPIAASYDPPINWDNAVNLKNFIRLVTRADYSWSFNARADYYMRFIGIKTYFFDLLAELTPPVFVMNFLGMAYLLKKKQLSLFISIFLATFLTGPFYVVYGFIALLTGFTMGILERFYMISALTMLIFFPLGVILTTDKIMDFLKYLSPAIIKKTYYKSFIISIFFLIPSLLFFYNFPKTDLHDVWVGDHFARDILSPLPKNSVVFLGGDNPFFNTLYAQYALGIRKDITLININGLDSSKVFVKRKEQIQRNNKKIPKEALGLETILSFKKDGPLFSIVGLQYWDEKKYGRLDWVPYGLLYKLNDKTEKSLKKEDYKKQQEKIWKNFLFSKENINIKISARSLTLTDIFDSYSQSLVHIGDYMLSKYNDPEKAKEYYQKAISYNPNRPDGYEGLGYYYFSSHDCAKAEKLFSHALSLNPSKKQIYVLLYATFVSCFNNLKQAEEIGDKFFAVFNTSISKELEEQLKKE